MIRVTRQIKCLIGQSPGVMPHPLTEVNFIMVEMSYLFIKQDQMIAFSIFLKKYGNYSDIDIYWFDNFLLWKLRAKLSSPW